MQIPRLKARNEAIDPFYIPAEVQIMSKLTLDADLVTRPVHHSLPWLFETVRISEANTRGSRESKDNS